MSSFEGDMIKALGLPKTTTNLQITMEYGNYPKASCEFYLTEDMMDAVRDNFSNKEPEKQERLKRMLDGN